MILAVPAAGVIQVFLRHWLALYRNSRLYRGFGVDVGGIIHLEGEGAAGAQGRRGAGATEPEECREPRGGRSAESREPSAGGSAGCRVPGAETESREPRA